MAQLIPLPLTVSCFSKIQIGLPFFQVVPEKGPLNCVCVCVCVGARACVCVYVHTYIGCCCCFDTVGWVTGRASGL